jgi:hypothetical protein
VGQNSWELPLSVAVAQGLRVQLVLPDLAALPDFDGIEEVRTHFDLSSDCLVSFPTSRAPKESRSSMLFARDVAVCRAADLLVPISVRPGGTMASLVQQAEREGKPVERRFEIPYQKERANLAYSVDPSDVNSDIASEADRYLVHWTRGFSTAWPGERMIDYYLAVASSRKYPRTALDSLMNMATTKQIHATTTHMPGKIATVSFSGQILSQLLPLMRWRARDRQMSFEPYGLGIEKYVAEAVGIRPVTYLKPGRLDNVPLCDRWICQGSGRISDWRQEDEYRHKGSLDLNRVPPNRICLFCPTQREAYLLRQRTNLRALALLNPDVECPIPWP